MAVTIIQKTIGNQMHYPEEVIPNQLYRTKTLKEDGMVIYLKVNLNTTPNFTMRFLLDDEHSNPEYGIVRYYICENNNGILQPFTLTVNTSGTFAAPLPIPKSSDMFYIEFIGINDADIEFFINSPTPWN